MRRVRLRFVSSSRPIRRASTCAEAAAPKTSCVPGLRSSAPSRSRSGRDDRLVLVAQRPVDEQQPVVVGVRRQLAAAPRAEQDDRGVGRQRDRRDAGAHLDEARGGPLARGEQVGKALGTVRRQALERARRALQSGLPQGRFEDPRHVPAAAQEAAEALLVAGAQRHVVAVLVERADVHVAQPGAEAVQQPLALREPLVDRRRVRDVEAEAGLRQRREVRLELGDGAPVALARSPCSRARARSRAPRSARARRSCRDARRWRRRCAATCSSIATSCFSRRRRPFDGACRLMK